MIRIKVWYDVNYKEEFEARINEWLEANPNIEIVSHRQSSSGRMDHHTTISILYKEVQP